MLCYFKSKKDKAWRVNTKDSMNVTMNLPENTLQVDQTVEQKQYQPRAENMNFNSMKGKRQGGMAKLNN